jgi:hypothetical protein
MGNAGHSTRVETKCSVVVKRGPCNAADNGQDGEIVAYDGYRFSQPMALEDAVHGVPYSLFHIDEPFASRDEKLCWFRSPFVEKCRVVGANIDERQTFEFSVVEFAKVIVDRDGQVVGLAHCLSRLNGPFQIA